MSTLTGQKIANTYKQLLQVGTDNNGLTATVQTVQDGAGTNSPLQLSNSTVNINGTFQVNGNSVALESSLAATSLALATSIDTANTRITSVSDFAVALSATFATSINNSNTNIAAVSALTSVNLESITSINSVINNFDFATSAELAATSLALATSIDTANTRITSVSDFAVALSATFATSINNSNLNIAAVSALTSVNKEAITSINVILGGSGFATTAELAATSLALATSIGTANTRITSVSDFAVALSATFATSINNSNTNIAAVSALTSVNLESITSINSVINNLDFATSAELAATSLALATSIGTANTRITSVSDFAVALSATFATSIDNSNTNITINANAITSINAVVAGVSVLTSINAAAITSINAIIEGDVSADSGTFNTLTVITSASVGGTFNVGGNVGIGISSPLSKLDIVGGPGFFPNRIIHVAGDLNPTGYDSGTSGARIGFTYSTVEVGGMRSGVTNGGAGTETAHLVFSTANLGTLSEKMRITSSGNVGIGTTAPVKKLHLAGPALATIGTLTDGATITPNFDTNQNFTVTLGGNRTLANPSNIDPGQTGSIFVVQDGIGGRTLSFGSYWKFASGTAPTMSTGVAAVDRIDYIVYNSTAIHAVATLNLS